jgi:hypothetical protein
MSGGIGRQGMVINPAEASHILAIVNIKAKVNGKGLILLSIKAAVPIILYNFFFLEYDNLCNLALDKMLYPSQLWVAMTVSLAE